MERIKVEDVSYSYISKYQKIDRAATGVLLF